MKFFASKTFGDMTWVVKLQEPEDSGVQHIGKVTFARSPISKWVFVPNFPCLGLTAEALEAVQFFLEEIAGGNDQTQIGWN